MDCMEILYDLKDLICEELDKINKKHDINPGELEMAYKAVDIIKDITTIEAMEDADFGGDSYDDDMSYARNRDSRGRYSSRRGRRSYDGGNYSNRRSYNNRMSMEGGYSGTESKEEMMRKIDDMQRQLQQM